MESCEELVLRVQRHGDREALRLLFQSVQQGVYNLLWRDLGNEQDAADATQEVFQRAIHALSTLRNPAAFRGWVYRIAQRVAASHFRRRDRERAAMVEVRQRVAILGSMAMETMEQNEIWTSVRKAVDSLDPELRTTVRLRYEHGLEYAEIADAMECPRGTVARRLHLAHRKLQEMLAGAGAAFSVSMVADALASEPPALMAPGLAEKLAEMASIASMPAAAAVGMGVWKWGAAAAGAALLAAGVAFLWFPPTDRPSSMGFSPPSSEPLARLESATAGNAPAALSRRTESLPESRGESAPLAVEELLPSFETAPETPAAQAVITGSVRDRATRQPIGGARVRAHEDIASETRKNPETVSDPQGLYTLELPTGKYELHSFASGYADFNIERGIARVRLTNGKYEEEDPEVKAVVAQYSVEAIAGQTVTRDIELVGGVEISGLVVDTAGLVVPSASVNFDMQFDKVSQCAFSYWPRGQGTDFRADLEGRFAVGPLFPEGLCTLRVWAEGFELTRELVELNGNSVYVAIVLRRGLTVRGRVVNPSGEPIEGAVVCTGEPLVERRGGDFRKTATRTDSEGRFTLRDLTHATRYLAAYAPGHVWAVTRVVSADESEITVVLTPAAQQIRGRIIDSHGGPLEGASVSVHHYNLESEELQGNLAFLDEGGGGDTCSHLSEGNWWAGFLPEAVRSPATQSGSDGTFTLEDVAVLEGVQACVEFRKEGYRNARRLVRSKDWTEVKLEIDAGWEESESR